MKVLNIEKLVITAVLACLTLAVTLSRQPEGIDQAIAESAVGPISTAVSRPFPPPPIYPVREATGPVMYIVLPRG